MLWNNLTNPTLFLQVNLPVNLLCYDLLDLFCNRGDGRFVLKEKEFNFLTIKFTIKSKLQRLKNRWLKYFKATQNNFKKSLYRPEFK